MNTCDIFTQIRPQYEGRTFLTFGAQHYSIDGFLSGLEKSAQILRNSGIQRGDRVLLLAKNSPGWLTACFSALSIGAIIVPVNPALTSSEVRHISCDSGAVAAIVDDDLAAALGEVDDSVKVMSTEPFKLSLEVFQVEMTGPSSCWTDHEARDAALIVYTSGTTGKPKGAVLSHASMLHTARMEAKHFLLSAKDTTIVLGPLSFLYPLLVNFLSCVAGGASVVLQERFHPRETLESIRTHSATVMMGVPTMYVMMCNLDGLRDLKLSSMRLCISAGAVLGASIVARFAGRFGVQLFDLWGLTEATPLTGYDPRVDGSVRPDSCGRALPGVKLRIVGADGRDVVTGDVGEVWAQTASCMLRYFENPAATAETIEDGWLKTGDLGWLSSDGYLHIVGRKKDLVIRGGVNIYPAEIEEVLFRHPATAECAVVGIPDEVFGERVRAYIVRKAASPISELTYRTFCESHLATYKVPAEFVFVEELPKGPTGKVLKRALKAKT